MIPTLYHPEYYVISALICCVPWASQIARQGFSPTWAAWSCSAYQVRAIAQLTPNQCSSSHSIARTRDELDLTWPDGSGQYWVQVKGVHGLCGSGSALSDLAFTWTCSTQSDPVMNHVSISIYGNHLAVKNWYTLAITNVLVVKTC